VPVSKTVLIESIGFASGLSIGQLRYMLSYANPATTISEQLFIIVTADIMILQPAA
jgi:hypothetical protein